MQANRNIPKKQANGNIRSQPLNMMRQANGNQIDSDGSDSEPRQANNNLIDSGGSDSEAGENVGPENLAQAFGDIGKGIPS